MTYGCQISTFTTSNPSRWLTYYQNWLDYGSTTEKKFITVKPHTLHLSARCFSIPFHLTPKFANFRWVHIKSLDYTQQSPFCVLFFSKLMKNDKRRSCVMRISFMELFFFLLLQTSKCTSKCLFYENPLRFNLACLWW